MLLGLTEDYSILLRVFGFLPFQHVVRVYSVVCKQWHCISLMQSHSTLTLNWTRDTGPHGTDMHERMQALSNTPMLACVSSLDLSNNLLGDACIYMLCESPFACNLTKLNLSRNELSNNGVSYLTSTPFLANLQELNLEGNRISSEGLQSISECSFMSGLKTLNLNQNLIDESGVIALSHSPYMSCLTNLSLNVNNIRNLGVKSISSSIFLADLQILSLSGCGLDNEDVKWIANGMMTNLVDLDLSDNLISDVSSLASYSKLMRLSKLNLKGNYIIEKDALVILTSNSLSNLTQLNLSCNCIANIEEIRNISNSNKKLQIDLQDNDPVRSLLLGDNL
ncbi:predicted protein [Naegleria gruberi]|uniref:Predicted protein n=1 Tax=Naegleria gruberi TaxID=5762 RepID=D2W230_NAEGR|nr:uncharacterized protein NAEGRDRAFT_75440 [Naegleria gruberi]EFC36872.1 predicted protein [Naegleria gruberi]|eukprot:XP_002669616.1 predicted protein [Naegleria gruberi strain NEG-M]